MDAADVAPATENGRGRNGDVAVSRSTRRLQVALAEIGFPLRIDGVYGPMTRTAVTDFQRAFAFWNLRIDGKAGLGTKAAIAYSRARGGKCSAHFRFRDFRSKGNGWIKVNRQLVRGLERYRREAGPVSIVSGYRDPLHNRSIGGASQSQHMYGNAADIPPRLSLERVRRMRVFTGIGIQPNGLVSHVDVRPGSTSNPTVWRY